jgi:hypothetical protein
MYTASFNVLPVHQPPHSLTPRICCQSRHTAPQSNPQHYFRVIQVEHSPSPHESVNLNPSDFLSVLGAIWFAIRQCSERSDLLSGSAWSGLICCQTVRGAVWFAVRQYVERSDLCKSRELISASGNFRCTTRRPVAALCSLAKWSP